MATYQKLKAKYSRGFTLFELLITVLAISLLAGIIFTVVDPGKQLADVRNTKRTSDARTITNAVYQYIIDNAGNRPGPGTLGESPQTLCAGTGSGCAGMLDLGDVLRDDTYVVDFPIDPQCEEPMSTCYRVSYTGWSGKIAVEAPLREEYKRTSIQIANWDIGLPMIFFGVAFLGFIAISLLVIFPRR